MGKTGGVGFFGKLPGMGDFVQRRLPAAFVSAWDAGFEAAVSAARGEFGAAWQDVWRAAPIWRFALMPGIGGVPAWLGVTGPSVDRVGRGFPMVLASPVTDAETFGRIVRGGGAWFDALERACGGAERTPTADAFDEAVAALPSPAEWLADAGRADPGPPDWAQATAWRMPWRARAEDAELAGWLSACMAVEDGCMWWTLGGARVPSSALLTRGLPQPQAYAAFLDAARADGCWRTRGELGQAAMRPGPAPVPAPAPAAAVASLPDDLDDVLGDLLPDVAPTYDTADATVPGAARTVANPLIDDFDDAPTLVPMPASPSPVPPAPRPDPAPAPAPGPGVALRQGGPLTWLAADNGQPDPRRQAARQVDAVLADAGSAFSMHDLEDRLLGLHAGLRERREDLLDPVPEDGAAIVVRFSAGEAELLRFGAASAWHWRRGQLRPLFDDSGPALAPDETETARPGDLVGVLSAPPSAPQAGLGRGDPPHCAAVSCIVAAGDRLLLLATDTLLRIPAETLAAALSGGTGEEARARIASAAGLVTDRLQWPIAVIEVGT